jgi:hypothetical protein
VDVETIAASRSRAHNRVKHLDFLASQYVDQAAVKSLLLEGKSQDEVAKLLAMSKRTVNTHARSPYQRYAALKTGNQRQMELDQHLDHAFMITVWGSLENAREAQQLCTLYDRERLHIESDT